MIYLCILFFPPLYFLIRKKWLPLLLSLFFFFLALICVAMVVLLPGALFLWVLAVGHAGFHYRREMMVKHADLIATKMAEKLRENPPQLPPKIQGRPPIPR